MGDMKTSQDKKRGEQLSKKAATERMRPLLPKAIERLGYLLDSDNENVALGAARDVISRFIPTLKATEITGADGKELIVAWKAIGDSLQSNATSTNTASEQE